MSMSRVRRTFIGTALIAAVATANAAAAVAPRASLTDIESEVMCTACRESLAVAESPQAYSERAYIRSLIAAGETKQQILNNLVAQYGSAVLAKPPAHGFNLTVYIVPAAVLGAGLAILALALPRWRRRARAAPAAAARPPLTQADARRLEEDLSRHPG
jgi:cytochrome c-type biogenesis protein CcmH/NrfF